MPTISLPQALEYAMQAHRAGRWAEAERMYRQILAVAPNHADALHLLGMLAFQTDSPAAAVDLIEKAILQNPDAADFHNDLGNALRVLGRFDESANAYRRALQIQPNLPSAQCNLGSVLGMQGRIEEAIVAFHRAIELQPDLAEAHNNLGNALLTQQQFEAAAASYRRAIQCAPAFAMAHNNLGNALRQLGNLPDAINAYQQALALNPDFPLALSNLGTALQFEDRLEDAIACFRRALEFQPDMAMVHSNLGNVLKQLGQVEAALTCFQRAIEVDPGATSIHSNYLAAWHDDPDTTLAGLFEAHCEFDRRHGAPLRVQWQPHRNSPNPDRRIRVGFVSSHFAGHPVGHFLIGPLEKFDTSQFEIFCYSDSPEADEMTRRIQSAASAWRVVAKMSDERLAEEIRHDGVDILFDLAGHTSRNRLLVFARKPAPIQITWLDYVGTTGLSAIDYLLADPRQVPPEAEPFYREKVLRMSHDYMCYDPPRDAPPIGRLPALDNKFVTFGSFNTPGKISPPIIGAWARILRRVPHSRLILKNRRLDTAESSKRLRQLFAQHGIAEERVDYLGFSARQDVFATYQRVDIGLDTFPYNGGLTTCEALWMGVPVVTCAGETFASRHGLTHLTAVGLPEMIAGDLDDYVEKAVTLTQDLPRLESLRGGLREQVAASPLCDSQRFADELGGLLRGVWREWCAGRAS